MPSRSTPAAARSCRAWSRPTSTRRTSTSLHLEDLDIKYPAEIRHAAGRGQRPARARVRLHGGPVGGSLFNIDVWLKKAIENDLVPGPRFASGREICGVGGLMDWNPDFRKIGMEGLILLVNGPDEARVPPASSSRTASSGSRPTPPATPPPPTPTTTTRSA